MSVRQNILLSNANKSVVTNLNNDITLNFPYNLFYQPINTRPKSFDFGGPCRTRTGDLLDAI